MHFQKSACMTEAVSFLFTLDLKDTRIQSLKVTVWLKFDRVSQSARGLTSWQVSKKVYTVLQCILYCCLDFLSCLNM